MITLIASESVYCTTIAVNNLSRLTMAGTADSKIFESAHHFQIKSERLIRIRIESRSFAGPYYKVTQQKLYT